MLAQIIVYSSRGKWKIKTFQDKIKLKKYINKSSSTEGTNGENFNQKKITICKKTQGINTLRPAYRKKNPTPQQQN